jgi:hypothetical protein
MGRPLERRSDAFNAALVEVAIVYSKVFGPQGCVQYFGMVGIKPELARRIVENRCRRRQPTT